MDSVGHAADVRLPRVAWKTGTSSGFRDAWTIAWNPDYVVGVWIGCPGGEASDELVGKRVAAPVAWDIFRQIYEDNESPWFARPDGVKRRDVCAVSGCPAGPDCPRTGEDWYIAGVSSFESCAVPGAAGRGGWGRRPAAHHGARARLHVPHGRWIFRRCTAPAARVHGGRALVCGRRVCRRGKPDALAACAGPAPCRLQRRARCERPHRYPRGVKWPS